MTTTIVVVPHTTRIRELRVKIKSLAVESRIIRKEERRVLDALSRCGDDRMKQMSLWWDHGRLREHRITDVRRESRYSLLVYGLLRGRRFRQVEPGSDASQISQEKLASILKRFWPHCADPAKTVADWIAE